MNRDATIGSNETLTVGQNRTKKVGANENVTIGANRSVTVGGSETATVAKQRTHSVGINETISVGAAQQVSIGGLQLVTVGGAQKINVGVSQSTHVGASQSTSVGAIRSVTVGGAGDLDRRHRIDDRGRPRNAHRDPRPDHEHRHGRFDQGGHALYPRCGRFGDHQTGEASITMNKDGTIVIKGKDLTLDGSGKINVTASGDVVTGSKGHQLTGGSV